MRTHLLLVVAGVLALATAAHAILIPRDTRANFLAHDVRVRTYDRSAARPREVGGNAGDMRSLTLTNYDLGYTYAFRKSEENDCHHRRTVLTVTAFHVHARQTTTVFLPTDAPPRMKDHEKAHVAIDAFCYDGASEKAGVFSRRMLRRDFEGCSLEEAQARLDQCFAGEFRDPYAVWRDRLHQALNDLDHNGQDGGLSPADALKRVLPKAE